MGCARFYFPDCSPAVPLLLPNPYARREMQSRSKSGGFEFMPSPSAAYYKELPNKVGDALTPEQYKVGSGLSQGWGRGRADEPS